MFYRRFQIGAGWSAGLALAVMPLAQAQTEPVALPPVSVESSPLVAESRTDEFGDRVTIVALEQIKALDAIDLASALRRTPGVSITRYNPVGAFGGGEGGAILIRGLGSSRPGGEVMMLVNGVPNSNAVFNHPLLDLMSLNSVERIELSRRANPVTGGNQFASVNLVPRRAERTGLSFSGSMGAFSTWGGQILVEAKGEGTDALIAQSHHESAGHRPDADGKLNSTVLHLGWQPAAHWDVAYFLSHTDNTATDPGAVGAVASTRGDIYNTENWLHTLTTSWEYPSASGWLKGYWNEGAGDWLRAQTSGNADSFNTFRLSGVRARNTLRVGEHGSLVAGADFDLARGKTVSAPPGGVGATRFGPDSFALFSAYAGYAQTWSRDGVSVTPSLGARVYEHEEFGSAVAWQAAVVARAGRWHGRVAVNRAVHFPGLDVAAFSAVAIPALGQSWRDLGPELLRQWEVGVGFDWSPDTVWELTLFRNDGRDRYVFVPPPPPPFRYVNAESFRTQGGELSVTTRLGNDVAVFGGVSWLEVEPDDLPYAPELMLNGGVSWQPRPRLRVDLDASYQAEQLAGAQARAVGAPNLERVGAFALINARVSWQLRAASGALPTQIHIAVENLLDREYNYRPGYPMPGVNWRIGFTTRY